MRHEQRADENSVGWMTLHPSTGKDRTLTVEEESVFHTTESRHEGVHTMRHNQRAAAKSVGWMTLPPCTGKDRTLMVEEEGVFHLTESRHD
jgi:hypothetical protein